MHIQFAELPVFNRERAKKFYTDHFNSQVAADEPMGNDGTMDRNEFAGAEMTLHFLRRKDDALLQSKLRRAHAGRARPHYHAARAAEDDEGRGADVCVDRHGTGNRDSLRRPLSAHVRRRGPSHAIDGQDDLNTAIGDRGIRASGQRGRTHDNDLTT